MSLERANDNGVFTAESYRRNVQTIQAMEDQLKWMKLENEKAELERKVREGETAREQLVQLQGQMTATAPGNVGNANVSNGPSIYPVQPSAYIEEVGYDNQPSSSRPTPNHSQRYHPRPNGNMNYSSIPPIAVNNSANVARHHPHMHRQTTFIPGSSPSDTNSIRPVHWQGDHDFRTSSLANAFGGTPYPPISYVQPAGATTVHPTSAAAASFVQSNSARQNIAAQRGTLSTGNAPRNEYAAGLAQSANMRQQPGNSFSNHKPPIFNPTTAVVRRWTAESVRQMLNQFKVKAPPNTHLDIPELRLRVSKDESSNLLLAIVDDQGQLIELKYYSELQGLPQRLQVQIATLAVSAQNEAGAGPTMHVNSLRGVNDVRLDPHFPRGGSQSFNDSLIPPDKPASESNEPSQNETTLVIPALTNDAALLYPSSVDPVSSVPSVPTRVHKPGTKVPTVSEPSNASLEVTSSKTFPNKLGDTAGTSRSTPPGSPPSDALTRRANSTLPQSSDATASPPPSVLGGPRTPSHANKNTLARDVLRALGVSGKRGRERDSENDDGRAPKKRVVDSSSSVLVTNLTSSTQAPTMTGTEVPITSTIPLSRPATKTMPYAPYGCNPYRAWTVRSSPTAQLHNLTPTLPVAAPNTVSFSMSTMVHSATTNSSSQTATLSLPVGTSSAGSDQSAVKALEIPSSLPTLTQRPPLADEDTVATSNLEVSPPSGVLPVQRNSATTSTSRSQSPINDQEVGAGSGKLPLFFRSSSTPPGATGGIDDEDYRNEEDIRIFGPAKPLSAKAFGKRKIPHVVIPPPPKWVKDFKVRKERRPNEAMFDEADDSEVDGFESPAQQEIGSQRHARIPVLDPKEDAAIQECSSRLREHPCKWNGCDSILNCSDKLYLHLQYHVEQNKAEKSFPCHWQRCGRVLLHRHEMISHLQTHAFMPLHCAYENCEETFRTARQYLQHSLQKHQNDKLRPSADPVMLQEDIELPDVPSVVPSYMAVARSVAQYPISPERHQVIGLWTLQNIFGKVDLAPQRYNLAKPFRPGEASAVELRSRHEYDFIETKPPVSSSPSRSAKWESVKDLPDLNSEEVTKMFKDKGLVLWGKGGDDDLIDQTTQAGSDEEAVEVLLQV